MHAASPPLRLPLNEKVNYLITKHDYDLISRVTLSLIANWTLILESSPRPTENSDLFQKCFSIRATIYFQLMQEFKRSLIRSVGSAQELAA